MKIGCRIHIRSLVELKILELYKKKFSLSQVFITHDLAVARQICNRIGVMYLGKLVEIGPSVEIIDHPIHPYTQALISAVLEPDPEASFNPIPIKGEIPSPVNTPSGCRFNTRCPFVKQICSKEEPKSLKVGEDHYVSCHDNTS